MARRSGGSGNICSRNIASRTTLIIMTDKVVIMVVFVVVEIMTILAVPVFAVLMIKGQREREGGRWRGGPGGERGEGEREGRERERVRK